MTPRLFSCFRVKETETAETATADGPVLVELFSSQGCATSPAAEMLLSRLGRGDFHLHVPVVVLAFHVDYWDYMGWKDPYGSSQWTVRQKDYVEALKLDTIFTPQVVVQGRAQSMADDEDVLLRMISAAPRLPALSFQATFKRPISESLEVSLTGTLRLKYNDNEFDIMVVLYENGLVNDCQGGENKGRVLSNDFVVRKMEKLFTVKDANCGKKTTISGKVHFSILDGFNSTKCGVAVFLQNKSHQILGSQNFKLPNEI